MVTELTEFNIAGKELYLSPILDLYNREIISYNISERPVFSQTLKILDEAAVIESFFGLLKSELLYLEKFNSVEHLREELEEYIEDHNNKCIKTALNNMSPVQYRTHDI